MLFAPLTIVLSSRDVDSQWGKAGGGRLSANSGARQCMIAVAVLVLLVGVWVARARAAFPGSNGKIVFVAGGNDYGGDALAVVNADGSGFARLPIRSRAISYFLAPNWSPRGRSIVFAASLTPLDTGIFTVRADGSRLLPVQGWSSRDDHASWSRDGRQIVFDAPAGPTPAGSQLVVSSGMGEAPRPLGRDHSDSDVLLDAYPEWSPTEDMICFARSTGSSPKHLYLERPDGSGLRQLASVPGTRPDWSPDGKELAFDNGRDVFVVNVDGTGLRRIARNGTYPAWSPDGILIAFQRLAPRHSVSDLWVMEADGSQEKRIAKNARAPSWQPRP
jgi:Tol biopolymer transport system component